MDAHTAVMASSSLAKELLTWKAQDLLRLGALVLSKTEDLNKKSWLAKNWWSIG